MREDIWDEMRHMQREMDRLWGGFWDMPQRKLLPGKAEIAAWVPATTDLKETDKEVIAQFDIPGVDKKDIELHVNEQSISVKAERKAELKKEEKGIYRHERSYSGFYRQSALPAEVVPDKATAEYKDGVLTVTMQKAHLKERNKGRHIDIK
ncbi:Hsp20/alpha crystallin family protein [Candidatus Woesearchaeota archaeon]|nr:Hsp20/alpha crystallin family protein [Candidatus Woesearchaeota archaeon]